MLPTAASIACQVLLCDSIIPHVVVVAIAAAAVGVGCLLFGGVCKKANIDTNESSCMKDLRRKVVKCCVEAAVVRAYGAAECVSTPAAPRCCSCPTQRENHKWKCKNVSDYYFSIHRLLIFHSLNKVFTLVPTARVLARPAVQADPGETHAGQRAARCARAMTHSPPFLARRSTQVPVSTTDCGFNIHRLTSLHQMNPLRVLAIWDNGNAASFPSALLRIAAPDAEEGGRC